jgi:predicted nucleic acid-binding protein
MRTALDSSVVILLQRRQTGWEQWRDILARAATEGPLLISPIAFAECSAGFPSLAVAQAQFESIQVRFDPFTAEAAYLAGRTFIDYRRLGGLRQHLIPDFLIAAHAAVQADRLAALDRGYLRLYFPQVPLLQPPV